MNPRFLASIKNASEAKLIKDIRIDIVDIKNIDDEPMGFAGLQNILSIKNILQNHKISVTMGNDFNPNNESMISNALNVEKFGIDYMKIALFNEEELNNHKSLLEILNLQHCRPICVLFADNHIAINNLKKIADIGYQGVMIDTMNKNGLSVMDILPTEILNSFIERAKFLKMTCGLAGSIKRSDISNIIKFNPDFIGFRGQLCKGGKDRNNLSLDETIKVSNYFIKSSGEENLKEA